VDECVETNNSFSSQLTVYPQPPIPPVNLALNKPVTVSSIENAGLEGPKAVDGNMGTRWSSLWGDPQSITIDLGAMYQIDEVVLYWETACAKEYYLKISNDGSVWTDVKHETNGSGGIENISVGADARFVQMLGIQRATQYGYSIWEIEVHGPEDTNVDAEPKLPLLFSLSNSYPNPFNPTTTIEFTLAERGNTRLMVFNMLGQEVATLFDQIAEPARRYRVVFDGSKLASGAYVVRLQSGKEYLSKRMMLLK
jgi:hypothetical protein